ncbi:MAG: MBL fold metallo-hydrolase [Acidimicrobiia bacterium]|nr:MBL fold metallo-hydrolase [Acidimicrobiia bacterium]
MGDATFNVGDVQVTRIEEAYGPTFPLDMMFVGFSQDIVDDHGGGAEFSKFYEVDTGMVLCSIHSWLVRTPQSVVLIDTCCGNGKDRPAMPTMHQLDTPFIDRLAAAGVAPEDVDYVVCTHLHVDHVGWNTHLVDGEWVPTFPNATYVMNSTEFDFWKPGNPASAAIEINAGVFEDSVLPAFDRDQVDLWDGDREIDGVLHLETATGHTPGHAVAWLESKGERAVFAGDSMHSPMQVYEPSLGCAFDIDAAAATAARRGLLETCVERGALLLPAHFASPHAWNVVQKGDGLAPVAAG